MGKFKDEHGYSRMGALLRGVVGGLTKGAIDTNPKIGVLQAQVQQNQQVIPQDPIQVSRDIGQALGAGVVAANGVLATKSWWGDFRDAFLRGTYAGGLQRWFQDNIKTVIIFSIALIFILKKTVFKNKKF